MAKENILAILGICIGAFITVLLGFVLFFLTKIDRNIHHLNVAIASREQPRRKEEPVDVSLGIDDDPIIGEPGAPMSIIIFSDFECSFCTVFYEKLYGSLYKDFIEPGDVNLVFRDYPLSIHPHAIDAAKAAECADDQGKFREMFAYLFENSDSLKSGGPLAWAEETQLDLEQFSACMADEATELEIEKDIEDANNAGVFGTPAFVIGGKLYTGTRPYPQLKKIIEEALHENRAALSPSEVHGLVRDSNNEIILLDVRKPEEYVKGHISGAINLDITTNDFTKAIDTFDTEVTYIIYCTKDTRSKKAFSLMKAADFSNVYRLNSGITGWEQNDYEIVQ